MGVHTTVQMYNILKLHESVVFFKERFGIESYLNILNHPHCLNIRTLPGPLKEKVIARLSQLSSIRGIKELIKYLNHEDWSGKYYRQFIDYTKKLDSLRGENFKKVLPEFFENSDKEDF